MLRHVDGAWEAPGQKRVYGLLIVEGQGGPGVVEVPARWVDAARNTISTRAICHSLPHRDPAEQLAIARCFLGVTTWQAVCKTFDIDWTKLPDSSVAPQLPATTPGPARNAPGLPRRGLAWRKCTYGEPCFLTPARVWLSTSR